MGNTFTLILIAIGAYLIGNINPAIIVGRLHGIDIRKEGSGNAGMTNTIRVIGLGAGIAVFTVDVLKAFLSVWLGIYLAGDAAGGMVAFAAVVVGHCYPALYKLKGGKGVASSLGAALALNWQTALMAAAVAGLMFLISGKRMSIASIGAVVSYPVFVYFMADDKRLFFFAIVAVLFLVIQHASNIQRIAKGEEKALTIAHGAHEENSEKTAEEKESREE
ncbi:MAG: glycerol-3-phosphate 1-O-acyltransferase PlsY [Mogibacterium sp.]|nr:glycerol-3-phosphate 1-O-acyltransferase PlsY [Mogibacterium sp.]